MVSKQDYNPDFLFSKRNVIPRFDRPPKKENENDAAMFDDVLYSFCSLFSGRRCTKTLIRHVRFSGCPLIVYLS